MMAFRPCGVVRQCSASSATAMCTSLPVQNSVIAWLSVYSFLFPLIFDEQYSELVL